VVFSASGTINVYGGRSDSYKNPAGLGAVNNGCIAPTGGHWIAPGLPCSSLIGRIGNGPPFEVGNSLAGTVTAGGELYLGVNDESTQSFVDNSGSWTVVVSGFYCIYDPITGACQP
jgi:hypothetical protein